MSDGFRLGDNVEFLAFGNTWKPGRVYGVLKDKIVIFAQGLVIGTDLFECDPKDVRKVG